jgi:hypothetical protein
MVTIGWHGLKVLGVYGAAAAATFAAVAAAGHLSPPATAAQAVEHEGPADIEE